MKKWLFLAILACWLILGCDIEEQKPGISTIKNTSANFDVVYKFKDNIEHTIVKQSEQSCAQPRYDYINSYEPSKRILLNTQYPHKNDVIYTFRERQSYAVKAKNTLGENVTISADGWMDDINLTSVSTEQSASTWLIYTDKPNFRAISSSGYKAKVSYNFDGSTFFIVITWGD